MPIDATALANASADQLFQWMTAEEFWNDPTKIAELEPVVKTVFAKLSSFSEAQQEMLVKASNRLAEVFGLPAAVDKYNAHLVKGNYKGLNEAETTFKFEDENGNPFPDNLKKKIVKDVAKMIDAKPDDIQDVKDDTLVGLKITDQSLKNTLEIELTHLDKEDKFKNLSPDKLKEELSWLRAIPEALIDTNWQGWQQTWDSAQKAFLKAKTPEDMGQVFCEQMFLMPFTLMANWANKFDAWVIAFSKQRAKALAEGGSTPTPGPVPTPGPTPEPAPEPTPGPTPGPTPTPGMSDADRMLMVINERVRIQQLMLFRSEYLKILYRDGAKDPAKLALAQELDAVFKDGMTLDQLTKDHPDLNKRMWDDLEVTLSNRDNKELRDLVLNMEIVPDKMKAHIRAMARDAENFEKGRPDPAPTGPIDFHKKSRRKVPHEVRNRNTNQLDAASRAEARIHDIVWGKPANGAICTKHRKGDISTGDHFGVLIEPKDGTITRYHQQGKDVISVTYFVNENKAIIMNGSNTGPNTEPVRILEGLGTDKPTINGRPMSENAAQNWANRMQANADLFKVGSKTKLKGNIVGRLQKDAQTEFANVFATMKSR